MGVDDSVDFHAFGPDLAGDPLTQGSSPTRPSHLVSMPKRRNPIATLLPAPPIPRSNLRDQVSNSGVVIGIDQAPKMASLSAERIARHGWDNVTIVQAPVETAAIPVMADAALFCAVHDVLQSPAALTNVFDHLRPGAWVAAGGGKYPPEWMVMMNPMIRAQHRPYIRSFDGFGRPWARLGEFVTDLWVDEFSLGAGYVAVGRAHSRGSAQAGSPPTRSGRRLPRSQIGSQRPAPERNVPGR